MKKSDGFTNGMGKSKPVFNPEGFINGNSKSDGFTNGMGGGSEKGMTNGMGGGFTNGMGESGIKPKNVFHKKQSIWRRIIPIFIVLIMVGSAMFLFTDESSDSSIVKIDGEFGEWNNYTDIGFADIQFIDAEKSLYIGMERENIFMGDGNRTESYLIFINDKTSEDGYYLAYDTYEYYIDVFGTNNKTKDARGYQFDSTRDKNDWNGYSSRYHYFSISRVNDVNHMELRLNSIQIGRTELSDLDFLIYHFDTNGDYEYSQILDYDVMTGKGIEDTRVQPHMYWKHNFNENTLEIHTEYSLAYSSIDYNIRIVEEEDELPVIEVENPEGEIVQEPVVQPHTSRVHEQKIKGTKLTITYDFTPQDVIWQCGGTIINSTANATLGDDGFKIYNLNHTIVECKLEGDFGIQYIQEGSTRNNLLSLGLPPSISSYNESVYYKMIAAWTDTPPTIDGVIDESAWNGMGTYHVNETKEMRIHASMNDTYLFLGIESLNDTSLENNDQCSVYFDTGQNKTSSPDLNDFKIEYNNDGTTKYYVGDTVGWTQIGVSPDVTIVNSTTDGHNSWEFRIHSDYLNYYGWFDSPEDWIGFGVFSIDYDSGTNHYTYFPDNYNTGTLNTSHANTPSKWSELYDGSSTDMTAIYTSGTVPTIDGTLSANEWDDADIYTVDLTEDIKIYTMRDSTYVYIALESFGDTNLDTGDRARVYFDCDHDATVDPDANDKMYQRNDGEFYYEGDGGWSSTTKPSGWSSARSTTSGYRSWEFRVTISELNETGDFWKYGDEIGFGCEVYDGQSENEFWVWYPDNYYSGEIPSTQYNMKPDTWGDLSVGITDMVALYTTSTPTINGVLAPGEWDDADTYTVDLTMDMKIYTMNDGTYVYIALESLGDSSSSVGDLGAVYFDCDHDATVDPDANDKQLELNDTETYYEGDGSVWQSTTKPSGWSSARSTTSGYRSWEFRVTISELNETGDFWQDGDEIGFGCLVHDHGATKFWVWYPDNYDGSEVPSTQYADKPDTWGDLMLDIPEFSDIILIIPFLLILNIVIFTKKRRGNDCE